MNNAFMNIQNSIPQILSRAIGTKFFLFLSLGATLCLTSCDKPSVVGLDVQPSTDLLHIVYLDTTTIVTRTVREDSLRTDELLIGEGICMLGKINDPTFGMSTGSIYTQLRLISDITSASNFGVNPVCDSIILALDYDPLTYGSRPRKPQLLNVYQLQENINTSLAYYSNNTIPRNSLDLTLGNAGYLFTPEPLDSVNNPLQVGTTILEPRLLPQVRVPMDKSFGQLLLNNQSSGNLVDDGTFRNFIKGLYITTENTPNLHPGEGNMMRFSMGPSALIVYYHHDSPAPNTALNYYFSLGSVARFNHFSHDYSPPLVDPKLDDQINPSTPPAQNATVFIQSMSGVKVSVKIPYLMNMIKAGPIAINKAELVINIDTTLDTGVPFNYDSLPAPTNLLIYGIGDDGITPFLIPDAFEGSTYFGGIYDPVYHQYVFNIARYLQQILDAKRFNTGFYILASNGAGYANRVTVGGGSPTSTRRMKLNITYTKLH